MNESYLQRSSTVQTKVHEVISNAWKHYWCLLYSYFKKWIELIIKKLHTCTRSNKP